jgi:hypothetical protein
MIGDLNLGFNLDSNSLQFSHQESDLLSGSVKGAWARLTAINLIFSARENDLISASLLPAELREYPASL